MVVRRQDPPAPIQVDDGDPPVLEQCRHGRALRPGADQRLAHADELADLGHQPLELVHLRRRPTARRRRIAEAPDYVRAFQPFQTHSQAVPVEHRDRGLVVGTRRPQLLGRVRVRDVNQTTVGLSPHARHALVDGVIVLEVLALQVLAALPSVVEPDEGHADVVLRTFANDEAVVRQSAGLVDEGRGGRPVRIVEHGVMQRSEDSLEPISIPHDAASLGAPHPRRVLAAAACHRPARTGRLATSLPLAHRDPLPSPVLRGDRG